MASLKFKDIETQILQSVQQKITVLAIKDPLGFELINGFINSSLQSELGGAISLGGPSLPCVCIVGKSTGITYFFALKILLPNLPL